MTTEVAVNPRVQRLFDCISEELEKAACKGGDHQVIIDFKISDGRIVGDAIVDSKRRVNLQNG